MAVANGGSGDVSVLLNQCVAPCPADLTGDGVIDFSDVNAFTVAFQTGDPSADLSGNGSVGFEAVNAFAAAFAAGCP